VLQVGLLSVASVSGNSDGRCTFIIYEAILFLHLYEDVTVIFGHQMSWTHYVNEMHIFDFVPVVILTNDN